MAMPIVTLLFDDGRTEEVKLTPRVLIEVERHFGSGKMPQIQGTLYGAWHKLGRPGDFLDWCDTLADVDERSSADVVPSEPGPSDGS